MAGAFSSSGPPTSGLRSTVSPSALLIGDCAGGHRKGEDRATVDPDRIRRAWADRTFNIGVATSPSGLVVVDLDMPKQAALAPERVAPSEG